MAIKIEFQWQDDSGAGVPLAQTYFKYRDTNNFFSPEWIGRTDNSGFATLDEVTISATVKLFAENPVIRMMTPGNIPFTAINAQLITTVSDGSVVLVQNDSTPAREPFRIAKYVLDIYNRSIRQFSPFGFVGPLNTQLGSPTKIEGIFPDNLLVASLSYTEPAGSYTTYPIIHFVPSSPPATPPSSIPLSTIAHELGHALHFSQVPYGQRVQSESQYLAWLAGTLGGTHNFDVPTTPFVAWIEVFGWFVHLYDAILVEAVVTGSTPPTEEQRQLDLFSLTNYPGTTTLLPSTVRGDNVEGALFRALFQDYASRMGLDFVVRTFIQSQSLEFSQYAEWIRMEHGRFSVQYSSLREAARNWGLTPLRSGSVRDVTRDCVGISGSFSIRDHVLSPDQRNSTSPVSVTRRLSDIDRDCA